jgi:CRISPR-associated endonuclease/helicase Cas3
LEAYDATAMTVVRELGLRTEVTRQLGALWGKSAKLGGGRMNLLLSHLLDTAAVAELLWDEFLSPGLRATLQRISGGDGRRFFAWLCGVHDCGKATPAFQRIDEAGALGVRAAGLMWRDAALEGKRWRHDKAGAKILRDELGGVWSAEAVAWVWPLVAGHHGSYPSVGIFGKGFIQFAEHHGRGPAWRGVQRAVVDVFTRCLGFPGLASVQPVEVPTKAEQLCLSGFVVMADWIASDTRGGHFQGLPLLEQVSLSASRERAGRAWPGLRLRGGWGALALPEPGDLVRRRFGQSSRPSQTQVVNMARTLPSPGVLFVEAPMGEGKTKAALAAAEVLAARFGANGVYIGMPTQATCDPMFTTVREWVRAFGEHLPDDVSLLHGKKMFNAEWRRMWERQDGDPVASFGSVGEDGTDEYGLPVGTGSCADAHEGPSEWLLGRHRGLLSPFVVGTIDQLLFAAARMKHVMLRFAGLSGKVVILDEVHAADVYMSQFLFEALRWLGQAGVPVLLLSATLPPEQRQRLARAYLQGAMGRVDVDLSAMPEPDGYPSVTAACAVDDKPAFFSESTAPWRPSVPVQVRWLPDVSSDAAAVAAAAQEKVASGGVALVVLNTVDRAQAVYRKLADAYPGEVHLLHGRLCVAHRADRTESCLHLLGPKAGSDRPERMVVVATQLAEQSFDVDADVLITDLAPMDLLLQRIGRLHRHEHTSRPAHLSIPQVFVTGVARGEPTPVFLGASEAIYGRYLLLRTAALLVRGAGMPGEDEMLTWSIPAQVPQLVSDTYGAEAVCLPEWTEAEDAAREKWESKQRERAAKARGHVLSREGQWASSTLAGLHQGGTGFSREEDVQPLVRDGESSAEVVIVRRDARGFCALDGTRLGQQGEASEHVRDAVLGGTTRLPARAELTAAVERELRPLDGWQDVPWLKHARALVLEESGVAEVDRFRLTYEALEGLKVAAG